MFFIIVSGEKTNFSLEVKNGIGTDHPQGPRKKRLSYSVPGIRGSPKNKSQGHNTLLCDIHGILLLQIADRQGSWPLVGL